MLTNNATKARGNCFTVPNVIYNLDLSITQDNSIRIILRCNHSIGDNSRPAVGRLLLVLFLT